MSVTIAAATLTITQTMIANYSSTPLFFANEKGSESGEFVNLHVMHDNGLQHTMSQTGARRFRRFGIVVAQIYVALDGGLARAQALAATILTILEGKTINDVWLEAGIFRVIGPADGRFLCTCTIPFSHDEVK